MITLRGLLILAFDGKISAMCSGAERAKWTFRKALNQSVLFLSAMELAKEISKEGL
jgi:hypothetical protein